MRTGTGQGHGYDGDDGRVVLQGLTKEFEHRPEPVVAVQDITLEIGQGEFFTLLGPSGCGKTTLLRLIAGFESPTRGKVILGARDLTPLPPHQRPVNTVFQNYALFPHLTVEGNVAFGLERRGLDRPSVRRRVEELLRLVRLEGLGARSIRQISGGQQQRVALARALAPGPQVLLLDEPLSALDAKLRKEMRAELKRLQSETGITFILVTHDQEEALTMSDRLAVMNAGRLFQIGRPQDIYHQPADRFVAAFMGDSNILDAELTTDETGGRILRFASGLTARPAPPATTMPLGKVSVVIRPEHVLLGSPTSTDAARGRIEHGDFLGTATTYQVRLNTGETLLARVSGQRGSSSSFRLQDEVSVRFEEGSVHILKD